MIIEEKKIKTDLIDYANAFKYENVEDIFKDALFFDLEHYVYKKPICVGIFGCCYYDNDKNELNITQYMIENEKDGKAIILKAIAYFELMREKYNKKYIVTFSGNNDFFVLNHLIKQYKLKYNVLDYYTSIDIQKLYEKVNLGKSIGLKALEKIFEINREEEIMSGSNIAKTFKKVITDEEYISRMPKEKIEKLLLYNEGDIVNLFYILTTWDKYMTEVKEVVAK